MEVETERKQNLGASSPVRQFINISIIDRNLKPSKKVIYKSFGCRFALQTKFSNLPSFLVEDNLGNKYYNFLLTNIT
jgi:hypothetical protein